MPVLVPELMLVLVLVLLVAGAAAAAPFLLLSSSSSSSFPTSSSPRGRVVGQESPSDSRFFGYSGVLAYGRLSKINILADKPIPAERSEGPCEQSGLRGGGIAPGGMPGGRDGFIAKILES